MKIDYSVLENIDYVFYYDIYNKLHCLNIIDNKNITTENTGNLWYKDAYGNCIIALKSGFTDKLYLFKKDRLNGLINKEFLENNCEKTIDITNYMC